ncbi:MAG: non-heme iron oxygenase ferredoxin subunit [Gemmatimonadota bacterium]|nr:non-heme iron oxygenase ferredoxin subunit [Gemmatimonadota bacterium]
MPQSTNSLFHPVADIDDVAEGELLGVKTPGGEQVCLFRHRGEIHAVSDCCTHSEFPISDGSLGPDGTLECTWHGARFDCRTGAVLKGPAEDPLPVYEVKVDSGKVLVGPRKKS